MRRYYYVIVDVGCIECGANTSIVGVYHTEKEALKRFEEYSKEKRAVGTPTSAIALVLKGKEKIENGQLYASSYFDHEQHSIELFKVEVEE